MCDQEEQRACKELNDNMLVWFAVKQSHPILRGNKNWNRAAQCNIQRESEIGYAKMAEPIEMPFEMVSRWTH